jgi:glycosyltransferase involved in cell wall biosynthesis
MPSISVCIPAYNEESTLESAIAQVESVLVRLQCDYEIIVCDDASLDGTGEVLRRLAKQNSHLRPIFHEVNQGIYETFEELYVAATKEAVFLLPADLEWPPETLATLVNYLDEGDIIVAARIRKYYGVSRSLISYIFNFIPWLLFGIRTYDAGAVKLVRTEVIRKVPIISKSPFSEAERIIRAVRAGYRLKIVPTVTRQRAAGVSHGVRVKVLLVALADFLRVWWDIRILKHG